MHRNICNSCGGTDPLIALDDPIRCPDCCGIGYVEEIDPVACACGNHKLQIYHTVLDGWIVYCPECGFEVSGNIDKNSAVEYWNAKNS